MANYSWNPDLSWSDFYSPRKHQLKIAWMWDFVSTSERWNFAWLEPVQVLRGLPQFTCASALLSLDQNCFLGTLTPAASYHVSTSPQHKSLSLDTLGSLLQENISCRQVAVIGLRVYNWVLLMIFFLQQCPQYLLAPRTCDNMNNYLGASSISSYLMTSKCYLQQQGLTIRL